MSIFRRLPCVHSCAKSVEDKGEFLASSGLCKFTGGEQMKQCEEIMRRLTAEVSSTVSEGTESTDLCNYALSSRITAAVG